MSSSVVTQQRARIDRPLQLANGLTMPTIHLGVYLTSGKETYQAVRWALEVCIACSCCARAVGTMLILAGWVSRVLLGDPPPFVKPLTMAQRRLRRDVPE
jgi:hypothetical protein